MNRAFEKELSRALAAESDTAVPETLLRRCRAQHIVKQRSGWRDLLHCQFKLLGWKVWALEAMAALALYSVGRELALWEKAWTLRNALFGLSTLAMLTALLGLPFLYRASQYKMLELEHATYAGIGRPLAMRFSWRGKRSCWECWYSMCGQLCHGASDNCWWCWPCHS